MAMEVSSKLAKSWLDTLRELVLSHLLHLFYEINSCQEKDNIQYEDEFEKYLAKDVAPSRVRLFPLPIFFCIHMFFC